MPARGPWERHQQGPGRGAAGAGTGMTGTTAPVHRCARLRIRTLAASRYPSSARAAPQPLAAHTLRGSVCSTSRYSSSACCRRGEGGGWGWDVRAGVGDKDGEGLTANEEGKVKGPAGGGERAVSHAPNPRRLHTALFSQPGNQAHPAGPFSSAVSPTAS